MASGINSTFRQVGIATGIAAWGAIFQHEVADDFPAAASARRAGRPTSPTSSPSAARRATGGRLVRVAEQAFVAGLDQILLSRRSSPSPAPSSRACWSAPPTSPSPVVQASAWSRNAVTRGSYSRGRAARPAVWPASGIS